MKKALMFFAFFILIYTSTLSAQNYKTAVGARLSSHAAAVNHGVSAKYFFAPTAAFEGLFTFGNKIAIGFLAEKHNNLGAEGVVWYYGGGLFGGFGESKFGAHGVVGLDYNWPQFPVNFSLDWKPELTFSNEFGFEPAVVGFTARYVIK